MMNTKFTDPKILEEDGMTQMELTKMVPRYEALAEVDSDSRAGVTYTIKRDRVTGKFSCNCPAWIYQKGGGRKPCKHVIRFVHAVKSVGLEIAEEPGEMKVFHTTKESTK